VSPKKSPATLAGLLVCQRRVSPQGASTKSIRFVLPTYPALGVRMQTLCATSLATRSRLLLLYVRSVPKVVNRNLFRLESSRAQRERSNARAILKLRMGPRFREDDGTLRIRPHPNPPPLPHGRGRGRNRAHPIQFNSKSPQFKIFALGSREHRVARTSSTWLAERVASDSPQPSPE
jgi:hypothetical protein